jgi:hypothetical protein
MSGKYVPLPTCMLCTTKRLQPETLHVYCSCQQPIEDGIASTPASYAWCCTCNLLLIHPTAAAAAAVGSLVLLLQPQPCALLGLYLRSSVSCMRAAEFHSATSGCQISKVASCCMQHTARNRRHAWQGQHLLYSAVILASTS